MRVWMRSMTRTLFGLSFNLVSAGKWFFLGSFLTCWRDERQTCEKSFVAKDFCCSSHTLSDRTDELVCTRVFLCNVFQEGRKKGEAKKTAERLMAVQHKMLCRLIEPETKKKYLRTRICWTCVSFFGSKITSAMGVLSSLFAFHSPRLRQFLVIGIDWRTSFYFDALSFASTIFILRLFLMSFLCAQKGALTELELS